MTMKTVSFATMQTYLPLIIIIAAFFVFKGLFKGVETGLESLNLKDTAEEKEAKKVITKADARRANDNPFDPVYHKTREKRKGFKILLLRKQSLLQLANELYSGGGVFGMGGNDSRAIAVFKQLKTKTQVSQFANDFFITTGRDLSNFLRENFRPETVAAIIARVDRLDIGYIAAETKRFDGETIL